MAKKVYKMLKPKEKKRNNSSEKLIEGFEEEITNSSSRAFGLASFSQNILQMFFGASYLIYFQVILGLNIELIFIAGIFYAIWNAFNDPIFGYLEDRYKGNKRGKRVPIIRMAAPIYMISFILVYIPLFGTESQLSLFLYYLFVLFFFDTMITIIGILVWLLPGEMALSSQNRGKIMNWGALGNGLAQMLALIATPLIINEDVPKGVHSSIILITIIIGIIAGSLLFISTSFIKEKYRHKEEEKVEFIKGFKETLKNKAFLIYEFSNALFWGGQAIIVAALVYWISYVIGNIGNLCVLFFFVAMFSCLPLWNKILEKVGLKNAFIYGLLTSGGSLLLFTLFAYNFILSTIGMLIFGACISSYFLLGQVVFADVIDSDEIQYGKRRDGIYSGVNAIFAKPLSSLGPAIFGVFIVAFGFNDTLDVQSATAQLGIVLGFTLIPGIIFILAGVIMLFYPLGGIEWIKQKEELHKLHKEREAAYFQSLK
jgi:GPH family glycoside/pentoside/hexuronide:cation symporter